MADSSCCIWSETFDLAQIHALINFNVSISDTVKFGLIRFDSSVRFLESLKNIGTKDFLEYKKLQFHIFHSSEFQGLLKIIVSGS